MYRYLIGATGYTAVAALREVGASRVETKMMETVLMLAGDSLTGSFEKIKEYMIHETQTKKGVWIRTANMYREEIGITW